jgi:DNA mismatch repair protein MutL
MQKIFPLSSETIAKIAAGEVIERPAYAVKELVENAIDANASSITIHIVDSGLNKIVVIDDGEGMSSEDIRECFKLHTTSKLAEEEQLRAIRTMGFRGEALASIASISNMIIKSKTRDDVAGTQIELQNGAVKNISPIGMPIGTSITIDNLFSSVPARKKILKGRRTEFRYILDIVSHMALAHPEIRFVLTHNSKTIFDLPKAKENTDRLQKIIGLAIFEQLVPITYTGQYVDFTGYLAKPQVVTKTTNKQFIFVNQRKITDKLISQAVKEAYGNLLEATASPIYILFLTIPPEVVDVNVHPRKEQVRFLNKDSLFQIIKKAVSENLTKNNLTFLNLDWKMRDGQTKSYAGQLLKQMVLSDAALLTTREKHAEIQQIHNLYLLTPTRQGLLIIDQHAAHERVLYQEFLKAFTKEKQKTEIFKLQKPAIITLSMTEQAALEEQKEELQKLGFTFKGDNLVSVPKLFKDWDYQKLINEMLEDVLEEKSIADIGQQENKMLAYLACRSAVKAGDPLTKDQMKKLLDQLEKSENNATCPHGRPVRIAVSLPELHKMFKRI